MRTRLLGVDFSGARDAGRRIWLAEGRLSRERLAVLSLQRAQDLPASGRLKGKAIPALVEYLAGMGPTFAGLDVPNSLPRDLLPEGQCSRSWADSLADYVASYPDADRFRAACRSISPGKELRRRCDLEAKTPFSPYNLRLYRQTWCFLREVAVPLLGRKRATLWPFQSPRQDVPHLLEICPASTLKHLGLYGRPYKGNGGERRRKREGLLKSLLSRTATDLPEALHHLTIDDTGGDALDALVALLATAEAVRTGAAERHQVDSEGEVFVWS